jgi:soluble lytic murein transglycosylase-like protein
MKFCYLLAGALLFVAAVAAVTPASAEGGDLIDELLARARTKPLAEAVRGNLILAAVEVPASLQETSVIDELLARARRGRAIGLGNDDLTALVDREAMALGIPIALARAVVKVESQWNPKETGTVGEVGLMQIKHSTARLMGFAGSRTELYDPKTNVRWGMKYLAGAYRLANGNVCQTALKYQGGHNAKRMTGIASRYCSKLNAYMAAK